MGVFMIQPGTFSPWHARRPYATSGRESGRIAKAVVGHLSCLVGARVSVSLEIRVEAPDGVPEDVVRIVQENCNTLQFKSHGFEKG